jgi:hypothetical protein
MNGLIPSGAQLDYERRIVTKETNTKTLLVIVAVVLAFNTIPALAKPPTINLKCGKLPNHKVESERQYLSKASGGGDMYNINITFIEKKADKKQIDKMLRECLAEAIKLDNSKDIVATAWFRPKQGANSNDDENLNIYGVLKYISYTASTKSIAIHSIELRKE